MRLSMSILACILVAASVPSLSRAKPPTIRTVDVGTLISEVGRGGDFKGQQLIVSGFSLGGRSGRNHLVNLGTQETYRSRHHLNFISIYNVRKPVVVREGMPLTFRIQVEESTAVTINGKSIVLIDTVFKECMSCKQPPAAINRAAPAGRTLSAAEFGDAWPLTVKTASVDCIASRAPSAILRVDGKTYALNGVARSAGFKSVALLWRDNPQIPGTKIPLTPLIRAALRECR